MRLRVLLRVCLRVRVFAIRVFPPPADRSLTQPPPSAMSSSDRRSASEIVNAVSDNMPRRRRYVVLETIDCPDDDGAEGIESSDERPRGRVWIDCRYTPETRSSGDDLVPERIGIYVDRTFAARSVSTGDVLRLTPLCAFWSPKAGVVIDYPLVRCSQWGQNAAPTRPVAPVMRVKP